MQTFSLKPSICFGPDALERLSELKGKRVFVVTDRFFTRSGLVSRVTGALTEGMWTVFDAVTPDPSLRLVAEGVAALRQWAPQTVIALGGGSPIDCAKAIRHFGQEGGERLPLWCIPTTAGTGSEVTSFAVLTDAEQGVKHPLVDDDLLPEVALLDPGFLTGVPPAVTADTGMDVLTHALEAYVASGANPFTDALAESAFLLAADRLERAVAGDQGAKEAMLYASCLAGIAFNSAGLGICHSLAHALGGRYHVAHGRINAMLLPHVVRFNSEAPAAAKKYGHLAARWGTSGTARALMGKLSRLRTRLGMPDKMPEPVALQEIARTALSDRCTAGNPRSVSEESLAAILREVSP